MPKKQEEELIEIVLDFLEENDKQIFTFINELKRKYNEKVPNKPRKILYSPGFGAGWTTWETSNNDLVKFMLDYKPFIDYLSEHKNLPDFEYPPFSLSLPEPIKTFAKECEKKFGRIPYLGGLKDLKVAEVEGRFRINEYDGNESIETENAIDWFE